MRRPHPNNPRCVLSSFQNLFFWTGSLKNFELPLLLGSCLQIGIINAEAWCRHQYRRWCCAAVHERGRDVCRHCPLLGWGRERSQLHNHKATTLEGEPQIRLALAPPRLKREVASVSSPEKGGGFCVATSHSCRWWQARDGVCVGACPAPLPLLGMVLAASQCHGKKTRHTKGTKAMAHAKG